MTWKYGFKKSDHGWKIAEIYADGCYALLDTDDWRFEEKEDAIESLKQILADLEEEL